MQTISNPFKTTIKGIKKSVDVRLTIRAIQNKLINNGIISESEEKFLKQYTDYGQTDQKDTI